MSSLGKHWKSKKESWNKLPREVVICKCGTSFEMVPFRNIKLRQKYCSLECGRKYRFLEFPAWNIGLKKVKEPKICETCKKDFIPTKNKQNFCSPKCFSNRVIPKSTKEKLSIAVTKNHQEKPRDSYGYDSGKIYLQRLNKEVFCRSSYEKFFYGECDKDANVSILEVETVVIPYINDSGVNSNYIVDCLVIVSGKPYLVEIKAEWKLKERKTQLKIEAGKIYSAINDITYVVLTEKQLFNSNSVTTMLQGETPVATADTFLKVKR